MQNVWLSFCFSCLICYIMFILAQKLYIRSSWTTTINGWLFSRQSIEYFQVGRQIQRNKFTQFSYMHHLKENTLLEILDVNYFWSSFFFFSFFFYFWVFFHEHSRFTGEQGKEEAISLTPLYHSNPLYRHLVISQKITVESSPLYITSSQTRTGNRWFPSASR